MKKFIQLFVAASTVLVLGACGNAEAQEGSTFTERITGTDPTMASNKVTMYTTDSGAAGSAVFQETEDGVTLHLSLQGVPAGEYGMHIHESGPATPPTFEDAGDHFNPTNVEHGVNSETGPHLGDLPNLVVPENGTVNQTFEIPGISLQPDAENTLDDEDGSSLIIHTQPDDYESQPSGDAGNRMMGGTIYPFASG